MLRTKSRKFYIKGWGRKACEEKCEWFNVYQGKQENLAENVFFRVFSWCRVGVGWHLF